MIRWLEANHRPVESLLRSSDLACFPIEDPTAPIPVLNAARFFRAVACQEGPDIGCRVIHAASVQELALLGRVALGARTPHEALRRIIAALPNHCSHEQFSLSPAPGGILLREIWTVRLDPETLHVVHQFNTAMIGTLCAMTGIQTPVFNRIEMVPHPEFGLEHLRPWFGAVLTASPTRTLALTIPQTVAERRFAVPSRDRMAVPGPADWSPLRGDGTLSGTVRPVLAAMLGDAPPSIDRLATAAGLSVRTLQRRLSSEGSSFSALLDDVRRQEALRDLAQGHGSICGLANDLGYSRQAALTRAVRRWTGKAPRHYRADAPGNA